MVARTILVSALLSSLTEAYIFSPDKTPTGRFLPFPRHRIPESENVDHVNLLIGNGGDTPNGSGGMIPSTGPPFAMTRWVAQTQENYVSATPYNVTRSKIHGFQATRQPAIWMGESGSIAVVPGVALEGNAAGIEWEFDKRGLPLDDSFRVPGEEIISPAYYAIELSDGKNGQILAEQSSTSRVGHLRFRFNLDKSIDSPYIYLDVARPSITSSNPVNKTQPTGFVTISPEQNEICGFSSERQDDIITPTSSRKTADTFHGFFCARFSTKFAWHGVIKEGEVLRGVNHAEGGPLGAYAFFPPSGTKLALVSVRVGTSFISIDQARQNIDLEIPDVNPEISDANGLMVGTLEHTAAHTRREWVEKLNRIQIGGATDAEKEIFYTAVARTLQYPSEQAEYGKYWSGYDGKVHEGEGVESYTGYSVWDTFRAAWGWQILFAPERVPGFINSMLADFKESGWLPMWKNIVETNIMVGTHADSLIAEAVKKGITGFDRDLAWQAVWKDATVAPKDDATTQYDDREEGVDYEVRAGLSSSYAVEGKGWVADDLHSESASRTLDYAYDDYAAYVLAHELGKTKEAQFLLERSKSAPFTLWNDKTGFFEARNADGSWAGEDRGWTEGDKWAYSFDVVHDIPQLIEKRGGNVAFVKSLEEHFNSGHNDHSNEPSHHIPYLYALSGAAWKTQERVREIARANYNNTPTGLSGNEDCGQMSAWYLFSALGFYPVNPVSGEYVIGSPLFNRIEIDLPGSTPSDPKKLIVVSVGGPRLPYVKSVQVNGVYLDKPVLKHEQIKDGAVIVFSMSPIIEEWGNDADVMRELDVNLGQLAPEFVAEEPPKEAVQKEKVAEQRRAKQEVIPDRSEL
ncbi:glycoside hydrolase family 92 protein [Macrolepiota fuliginosa MF-IS2]|uniref:Glycoside hydrolase family 92 protein n=1 Tax=Macrolepiota fuliginosa MF-IS2 TaxID=1400762 RepID=A0A9P6C145_9AGAR|nr:glycoside hydrolase family 92 protein [Macrolepiota fuliginosa MF-IS2]